MPPRWIWFHRLSRGERTASCGAARHWEPREPRASALLSWASYLLGEFFHVSGVIATVTTGLIMGWHQHTVLPAGVRLQGRAVAELMRFVLEALVFILIGFSLRGVIDRIGGIGLWIAQVETLNFMAVHSRGAWRAAWRHAA